MCRLTEKNKAVSTMFSSIAKKYDFLNHLLSFNIDKKWRNNSIDLINGNVVLDVATGTGDVAMKLAEKGINKVIAIDLSLGMLDVAKKKTKMSYNGAIQFVCGSAENLPFGDESFDDVIIAFGFRNVDNRIGSLYEFKRILKKKGRLVILEFNNPPKSIFSYVYNIYAHRFLPIVGKLISQNINAYIYLPNSIDSFPNVDFISSMMKRVGFQEVKYYPLTFGVSYIHTGLKY